MHNLVNVPVFGILLTLVAYEIGVLINKKTKQALFNPLLIAIGLIICFLATTGIEYDVYNKGGSIISFLLGPATAVLAIPLYKQIDKLKSSGIAVVIGIAAGCVTALVGVFYLNKLIGIVDPVAISLYPKSVTAAISSEISKQIGGIPALTVAVTVLTGITGNVLGPILIKVFRIKDEVAAGIAMGTASHAIGTAKAMQLGEVQGAMGSLAISVAGLFTVFLAPLLLRILP